jgi:hypothetical protein
MKISHTVAVLLVVCTTAFAIVGCDRRKPTLTEEKVIRTSENMTVLSVDFMNERDRAITRVYVGSETKQIGGIFTFHGYHPEITIGLKAESKLLYQKNMSSYADTQIIDDKYIYRLCVNLKVDAQLCTDNTES